MLEKLIFIKKIDDKLYQFDFSNDSDIAWGENWNITPTAIIPNITPESEVISSSYQVELPFDLYLASNNTCFSMQDCIDGIISLGFTSIDIQKNMIKFDFGEDLDVFLEKLTKIDAKILKKYD